MTANQLPYELVVVDVDGTLLDDSRLITPAMRAVAARARQAGVRLTLATGRVYASAVQVADDFGVTEPIISDGGAVVRWPDGCSLRDLRVDPQVAAAILAAVASEDADCHVFYPDAILVNRRSAAVERYAARLGVRMDPHANLAQAAAVRADGPTMIVLRGDARTAATMRARYGALFGTAVQVTSTAPHLVDFLHHEAGKDRALQFLCDQLGVAIGRVIAIGDGINDLDMIRQAGLGVLVGNAAPELWPYASYVTQASYSAGIAEVIERFCLK